MEEIVDDIRATIAEPKLFHARSYMAKAPVERKVVDLNNLVAETISFLAPQAKSRQLCCEAT